MNHRSIAMPRVNVNDETATITRWLKSDLEWVNSGEIIAEIETSKAILELTSETDGYVLSVAPAGGSVRVGAVIALVFDQRPSDQRARDLLAQEKSAPAAHVPGDRVISRQAQALLTKYALAPDQIPGRGAIRAEDVERAAASGSQAPGDAVDWASVVDRVQAGDDAVILYGAADQGVVVSDCLKAAGLVPVAYLDDKRSGNLDGLPILPPALMGRLWEKGLRKAHVCISAPRAKQTAADRLKAAGFEIIPVIHPSAVISPSAVLGEGVFVGPLVIIGPEARLGNYAQINSAASIPHHTRIGDHARLSDGVHLGGHVTIGDRAFIGLSVTVNADITVGNDVTVVSGVTVFNHVPDNTVVRVTEPLRAPR